MEPVRIENPDIPQANTIAHLVAVVTTVVRKGTVTEADIAALNSPRQIAYYLQAARLLGLVDRDDQPTERAPALVGLEADAQRRLLYFLFEDSAAGRAWRRWAGARRLTEVDPDSAEAFLADCSIGLSPKTQYRRATTLKAWLRQVQPFGYAGRERWLTPRGRSGDPNEPAEEAG